MKCKAKRDKRVTVQQLRGTADGHGHVDNTTNANWSDVCVAWCSVVSKGGREFWKVSQVNADVSHVWRTDWSRTTEALTPDMRIVYAGDVYEILSVINVDLANEEIEIQTKRKT